MKLNSKIKLWLIEILFFVLIPLLGRKRYNRLLLTQSFRTGEISDSVDTPYNVCEGLILFSEISKIRQGPSGSRHTRRILEPSCGNGSMVDAIENYFMYATIHMVEIDRHRMKKSIEKVVRLDQPKNNYQYYIRDFLEFDPAHHLEGGCLYDLVLMNPPFRRSPLDTGSYSYKCLGHVIKAVGMLAEYGVCMAIIPEVMFYSIHPRSIAFRRFLRKCSMAQVDKLGKKVCNYPVSVCMLKIKR